MFELDELRMLVDKLVGLDPDELCDGESVEVLHRELSRLEAVTARASAAFDRAKGWAPDGARTASAWIAAKRRLPTPEVKRRLRLGRAMADLPVAGEAWLAGDIDSAHMRLLRGVRRPGLESLLARDEHLLVEHAKTLHFKGFGQCIAYWLQHAAPDTADGDAADLHRRRSCHVSTTFGGMVRGDFELDPVGGAIVDAALDRIADGMFRAEWADAKARLGREPTLDDLARSPAQRRADALVEMATLSQSAPVDGRRPRPLFSVYVGYDKFVRLCELANGTVVAPGALVPWLSDVDIERVVFDGDGRVVDVGKRRRLFRGATRRAVQLRDRECFHPLCDLPAEDCEIDHIEAYSCGGPTATHNGQPACGFHNRWKHVNPAPPERPPEKRPETRSQGTAHHRTVSKRPDG